MISEKRALEKIIKKSMKSVLKQVKRYSPQITFKTFYGAVDIAPYNLAIWYFFKSDNDLEQAKRIGLDDLVEKLTIYEMITNRYPSPVFENNNLISLDKSKIKLLSDNETEKAKIDIIFCKYKVIRDLICFSSEEDVKKKADGNYYYYFK